MIYNYKVKFKCYWYNTGAADNHVYTNSEEFYTLKDAQEFSARVDEQYQKAKAFENSEITYAEYSAWQESFDVIEIENGFIESLSYIVKVTPETEVRL